MSALQSALAELRTCADTGSSAELLAAQTNPAPIGA